MDDEIYTKFNFEILYDEDKINRLLKSIKLNKPDYNFKIYIKKHISNINFNDMNISNYVDDSNLLSKINKDIIKNMKQEYEKEKIIFKKNCLIINTFIYKGYSYGYYKKPSLLKLFINVELIKNLKVGTNENLIKNEAIKKYSIESKKYKELFETIKQKHDEYFNNVVKLKTESSLKYFIICKLSQIKKNKMALPDKDKILKQWKDSLKYEKNKYYENKYKFEEYQCILDFYEYIHFIKPQKPYNCYLLYFIKNYNKIKFKDFNDLLNNYNNESLEEKQNIQLLNHRLLLGYKFKCLYYYKNKSLIFPSKRYNSFNIFLKSNSYLMKNIYQYNFKYLANKFSNLNNKDKNKNILEYNQTVEKYKKIKNKLNNYIFDLPNKTINIFNFYIKDKLKDKNIEYVFNKKELINYINEFKNLNKDNYYELFNKNNLKYEVQIQQFEYFGFYCKNIDTSDINKLNKFIENEILNFYLYINDNAKNKKNYNLNYYLNCLDKKLEKLE